MRKLYGDAEQLARGNRLRRVHRAAVKRRLNQRLGSVLVEEKSYHDVGAATRQGA